MQWCFNDYLISTDKSLLSLKTIQGFLIRSYWANERPIDVIKKSIANSICFGIYDKNIQVGFARVVSDYATMFWVADVFIEEAYRGKGLGKKLVKCIIETEEIEGLLGVLMTRDAHGLYEQFGFAKVPDVAMARRRV